MPRSFSVLILDGGDYGTLKVLRCLGQVPEVTVHILSRAHQPLARFSRYCIKCHYHNSQKDPEWIDVIKDIIVRYKINVLLPITMRSIEFVSRNCSALKDIAAIPPTPEFGKLKMAQDKWSFHHFASEQGFPVVPTVFVADGTCITAKPADLDLVEFPALLKPTTERGGQGIVKIESRSDFYNVVEWKKILKTGQRYVVQSFIPGVDLCLGVFCKQGKILCYTLQRDLLSLSDYFGHQKVMEFVHDDRAIEIGRRIISAMAWDGMAFIDFRIDQRDNTLKLLELNPRLGRAFLGALAAGVNFPLNSCLCAMGISFSDRQREAVRYAHPLAYLDILMSQIIRKRTLVKLRWRESGLRYSVNDPLPELVEVIQRVRKIKLLRSVHNRKN